MVQVNKERDIRQSKHNMITYIFLAMPQKGSKLNDVENCIFCVNHVHVFFHTCLFLSAYLFDLLMEVVAESVFYVTTSHDFQNVSCLRNFNAGLFVRYSKLSILLLSINFAFHEVIL